jgi:RNA-directed DNA polymerase
MDLIVDRSNAQEPVELHYHGDDLFAPYQRRRGLPIGNLTSQFFANLYLDRFDHFITEVLRAPYLRYVDDFALFDDNPAVLSEWRDRIRQFLEGRRLKLHPDKTRIAPTSEPAHFLGFTATASNAKCAPTMPSSRLALSPRDCSSISPSPHPSLFGSLPLGSRA